MISGSIGQKLRQTREEQERTLDEIAIVTRIRLRYLQAMEADDFEVLPSAVQQRGFLRSYAKCLGIAPEPLVVWLEEGKRPSLDEQPPIAAELQSEEAKETENGGGKLENIGERLKNQRELLGFSISDVEHQTHVKPRYLHALEEGRFDDLPSPVQGRGMLKNYASFLGLDPDPLLLGFAEDSQARLKEKQSRQEATYSQHSEMELETRSWFVRVFSQQFIVSCLFALVLLVVIVWASMQVFEKRAEESEATPSIPGIAEILLPSFTPSPTSTLIFTPQVGIEIDVEATVANSVEEETESTLVPVEEGEIQVQLAIVQRAWVRVTVDGEEKFSGRMLPGSIHVFAGEERIEVLTGNAAGVILTYNQQELGVLGIYGGVANLIFTRGGILAPTPSITPTPTITPTFTITPTPQN
ncbi:MAG: DUF4115 domain-containing protein [Chloroflexota bacterium]|nr:DUF4115 domain-containing protein [Chloroflexota bacterium]